MMQTVVIHKMHAGVHTLDVGMEEEAGIVLEVHEDNQSSAEYDSDPENDQKHSFGWILSSNSIFERSLGIARRPLAEKGGQEGPERDGEKTRQ